MIFVLWTLSGCLFITDADVADRLDLDDDGWATDQVSGGRDCDDDDPDAYPGAPELCGGRDEDCDGELSPEEIDDDGDGYTECDGDCDDTRDDVSPGEVERCDDDDIDEDCNGLAEDDDPGVTLAQSWFPDNDGDGVGDSEHPGTPFCSPPAGWSAFHADCDDSDPTISPFVDDVCNERDDDCDFEIDEDCT